MRKKLIFIIIILISIFLFTNYKITEYTNLVNFTINKDTIYYVTYINDISTIYKTKINENNPQKIANLNSSCYFDNTYLYCSNTKDIQVYDLNLNLLYRTSDTSDINIIPYKDTFLKLKNNNLYLTFQTETLFRILEEKGKYKDYYKTKDNTYLLFIKDNNSYIYNLNNNNYESIEYEKYFKYDEGFIFYNSSNIYIVNLNKNEFKTINNPLNTDFYYEGTFNNDYLYLCDNNNFIAYDIIKNKIYEIDIPSLNINNLIKNDNYLYYFYENNISIIDLNNLPKKEINYQENNNEKLNKYIKEIEETYHLNIHLNDNTKFPDFSYENISNYETIFLTLEKITPILNKFTRNFFDNFTSKNSYLNLYLTGKLTPNNENQTSYPIGYSLFYDNKYFIVIDITNKNITETLCHELMHNIEFLLEENIFPDWDLYNPPDFTYNNSYNIVTPFNYTLTENDLNNIYFVDKYSHTYPEEDRARIFENICPCKTSPLLNYPHLKAKALYLKKIVLANYPYLEEVFASLN